MEARGMGTSDVDLAERIFKRIVVGGSVLAGGPPQADAVGGRGPKRKIITFPKSASQTQHTHYPTGSVTPGDRGNSENSFPVRDKSAYPLAKRQMAADCGLKSVNINTKWPPTERATTGDRNEFSRVSQSAISFQAPHGHGTPRKGLRGSKLCPGSQHSAPNRSHRTGVHSQASGPSGLHAEQSYPNSPTHSSLTKNARHSVFLVGEEKIENDLVSYNKWNSSDQALRLQTRLSNLSCSRSTKRASEMVQHRLDPMYQMSGSRVSLQNRYGIDDTEMQRLREMTQIREDLLSDLKRMNFPFFIQAGPTTANHQDSINSWTNLNTSKDASPNSKDITKIQESSRNKPSLQSPSSEPSQYKTATDDIEYPVRTFSRMKTSDSTEDY